MFETVLDGLRNGSLTATPENLDVLLTASDVLTDLIGMSRSGEAAPSDFGGECRAQLERIIELGSAGGTHGASGDDEIGGEPAPADFDGLDFVPVSVDFADAASDLAALPGTGDGTSTFAITFRPKPEMLKNANEPLYVLRALGKLGALDLEAHLDRLPQLTELEVDHPYIWWTATLKTVAARAQIDEVFEYVIGDCDLEITEVAADVTSEAPAGAIAPEVAAILAGLGPDMPAPDLPEAAAPSLVPQAPAAKPRANQGNKPTASGAKPAAAEPGEAAGGNRAAPAKAAATTTRIELERIDRVVNMVGELVISQAMLGQIVQDLPEATQRPADRRFWKRSCITRANSKTASCRCVPSRSARCSSACRGWCANSRPRPHKKVRLEMAGETTEVDRSIIERLGDPLTHIIRNSVDHGIETPADRVAAGKPEEGSIRLWAEHRGGPHRHRDQATTAPASIPSACSRKRKEQGPGRPRRSLSEDEISNLIMLPGFSTAETVSDISGRGVGMDVVRSNIQDIGGRISLKSVRGTGMTIQLALPLTLAVMDGMVIKVGQQTYVMPLSTIVECLRPPRSDSQQP